MQWPRISLVTPTFNREEYLEETICSVLDQNYPNLEYIIIDGGSSIETQTILNKYSHKFAVCISEKDEGIYHALNKGFSKCQGDVLGWINSDDILLPGALVKVGKIFENSPGLEWLTGAATTINRRSEIVKVVAQPKFKSSSILFGDVRGIQQESTFFGRRLWERAGGSFDVSYQYAADFDLWCRFFASTSLRHVALPIGAFRRHGNQLSVEKSSEYRCEIKKIRSFHRRRLSSFRYCAGLYEALRLRVLGAKVTQYDYYYREGDDTYVEDW